MNSVFSVIQGFPPLRETIYVDTPGTYLFHASVKNLKYTIGNVEGPMFTFEKGTYVVSVIGPKGYPFVLRGRLLETKD